VGINDETEDEGNTNRNNKGESMQQFIGNIQSNELEKF
jgi:hypothetical protein